MKKRAVLRLGLIVIIIIFAIIVGIKFIEKTNSDKDELSEVGAINNQEDVVTQEKKASQGIAIPGWENIRIPANTKEVSIDFNNPEQNVGLYYLTFELRLLNSNNDDYEILYKSDFIEPGQHVQKITLARELSEGEYEAVIHVQPYKMDEAKTPANNADMEVNLIVE